MDRLLVIDDEADMQRSFQRVFASSDVELTTASSGEEGLRLLGCVKPDLVIMDIRMEGMSGLETLRRIRQSDARLPVIMMTAYGTTRTAIEAMKLGAYDYLLKPFDVPKLKQVVAAALKAARDMKRVVTLAAGEALGGETGAGDEPGEEESAGDDSGVSLVGRSEAMQSVFKLIGQLAASDATVLVTGESGTGKELVARAIYQHSRRGDRPWVAINCAAIPEALLESELFGHEKGAFTGASGQRIGRFEQCHGGTVFLDEIGDMALATQAKILRVLQSGTFERVGGNETVHVDVRVIAATNQPLERTVAERRFREDLYYRLNVVRIHMPPLRERGEDIRALVQYFLRKVARGNRQSPRLISPEALARLEKCPWPGNVRELENAIHRAMVVAKGEAILPGDLPPEIGAGAFHESARRQEITPEAVPPAVVPKDAAEVTPLVAALFQWARQHPELKVIDAVERELVVSALRESHGNQAHAASVLGMTRATLRKRMERFAIRSERTFE